MTSPDFLLTLNLSPDFLLTHDFCPDEDCQGRKGKRKRPVSRSAGRRGRKGADEEEEKEGEEEA